MRALRMTLAYDGTHFAGWQRQRGQRTVQAEIEKALERITGVFSLVTASGRTDSGVHALAQVAAFQTPSALPEAVLMKALNAEMPDDIFIFEMSPAPHDFHPIRDAVRKRYRYIIQDGRTPDLFNRDYCWRVFQKLDVPAMQTAAQALVGELDFAAFETHGSSRLSTVRTVYDLVVEQRPGEFTQRVEIEVEANGFLYNMVRNIVGTLVQVGRGGKDSNWPSQVLASRDRRKAGMTAPAHGLFMMWVSYDI